MNNRTYCPFCGKEAHGLIIDGQDLKVEATGMIIGSWWCGTCNRMIHWGKKSESPHKKRQRLQVR